MACFKCVNDSLVPSERTIAGKRSQGFGIGVEERHDGVHELLAVELISVEVTAGECDRAVVARHASHNFLLALNWAELVAVHEDVARRDLDTTKVVLDPGAAVADSVRGAIVGELILVGVLGNVLDVAHTDLSARSRIEELQQLALSAVGAKSAELPHLSRPSGPEQ